MSINIRFGTDGVRGIIDQDFNELTVALTVEATLRYWASRYGVNKVLIGYDTRFKSRDYALVAGNVARQFGLDVSITIEPTPTPVISWFLRKYKYDLAIQITASHNPPEYNGVKIINQYGASILDEDTKEIEKILGREFQDILKTVSNLPLRPIDYVNPRFEYIDYIVSEVEVKFKPVRKLKVIFDPIHGSSIGYTDEILKRLGMEVTSVRNNYDVKFGGTLPDPEPENVKKMINEVVSGKYDLGISHDGDADRLAIVDRKLGYISANTLLCIITYEFAKRGIFKKGIARTVSTTHLIDDIAKDFNLKVIETPVGIKYIAKLLINNEVDAGGEESGGIAFSWHIPEKDGIYTAALVTSITTRVELQDIVKEIESRYGARYFKRINVKITNAKELIERGKNIIVSKFRSLDKIENVNDIDGIKIIMTNSWVLLRASGTERDKLRVYVEASSKEFLEKVINYVEKIIDELRSIP